MADQSYWNNALPQNLSVGFSGGFNHSILGDMMGYQQQQYGWVKAPKEARKKSFREEMQDEVNLWLKEVV